LFLPAPPLPQPHPLSLHDALPISPWPDGSPRTLAGGTSDGSRAAVVPVRRRPRTCVRTRRTGAPRALSTQCHYSGSPVPPGGCRSEEHTSELQSRENLVCRLLLEK